MKKTKSWKPLPKRYTQSVLSGITDMAQKGSSRAAIARALGLNRNCWSAYLKCEEAYISGQDLLAEQVQKEVLKTLKTSTVTQKMLVERLGIFQSSLKLDFEIDDLESCNKSLGIVMKKYLEGVITGDVLENFRKSVSTLSQSYVDVDTAERLSKIEELISKQGL